MIDIKRGQIYWLHIKEGGADHKQLGNRPVIVIQSDELNDSSLLTTLVIPTTTKDRANDFDNVELKNTRLPELSVALCSNMQIIDKYALKESSYICDIDDKDLLKINEYLKNIIAV